MRSIEVSRDRLRGPLSSLRQMNKRCVAMRVSECDRSQHNPARPRHRRDVHRRGARGGRPARHGKNADHVRRARCEFDGKDRCEGQKGHTKLVVGSGSLATKPAGFACRFMSASPTKATTSLRVREMTRWPGAEVRCANREFAGSVSVQCSRRRRDMDRGAYSSGESPNSTKRGSLVKVSIRR